MRHTPESITARAFAMSQDTWLRHANPWSVWTRIATCLPLLVLAIWSRAWISGWSVLLIAAASLWIWLNPRVFRRPKTTDNWASQGVLGERFWLSRKSIPIPRHHRVVPHVLTSVASLGLAPLAYGLWTLHLCPTLIGLLLVYAGKLWFFDRMVWLYRDMKNGPDAGL